MKKMKRLEDAHARIPELELKGLEERGEGGLLPEQSHPFVPVGQE